MSYNANGATSGTAPASQTKTHDVALTLAGNSGNLAKTGYTFAGWNTAANGSGSDYAAGGIYTANATVILYAKWTPNTYTVTYNGNGSTGGSTPNSSHTYDVARSLNANGYTWSGYSFAGWATSSEGSVAYSDGQSVVNLASAQGATVTLYAKWTTTGTVTTPAFSPDGGAHPGSSVNVTITCATADATIRYTTNGTEPTESSASVASGGSVNVLLPGTLKAKAFKSGMNPSETKTANYTSSGSVATPAFNPDGGTHPGSGVNVTITCATAGATIRYTSGSGTTLGADPTTASTVVPVNGIVNVPVPGWLKAKAWKDGMTESGVKSAVYTVEPGDCTCDDFESYSLNTWPSPWHADANAAADTANNRVVSDPAGGANKVLRLYGVLGDFWGALAYLSCDIPADFEVEARIYNGGETIPASGHQWRGGIHLRTDTSWANYSRSLIDFDGQGNALRGDGSVIGSYALQTWHTVHIRYTRVGTSLTLSYWINGEDKGTASLQIADLQLELSLNHLELSVNAGSAFFDDLCLSPSPLSYTVSYNANGATSGTVPASQTKTHDVPLTLAGNSGNLAKTGYTFSGWNTAANGSGTDYAAGGNYTANASATLYAKWTILLSAPAATAATSITSSGFQANWGSVSGATGYRLDISTSSSFSSYVVNNYDMGNNLTANVTGLSSGTTYYYRVRAYNGSSTSVNSSTISVTTTGGVTTYTVSYNANGATSGTVPAPQTKTRDVPLKLAANSGNLAKSGSIFAGWNTAADGTGTGYAAGGIYAPYGIFTLNASVTLYAKWMAGSTISTSQRIYFTYDSSSYWAFIYDYTSGQQENCSPGFIAYNSYQTFIHGLWEVQVAYIYNVAEGRYTEALAIQDAVL